MNKLTLIVLRTASLAALCLCLSSTSRAADRAEQLMVANGSVSLSNVGPSVKIGVTKRAVFEALGNADVVRQDGSLIYRRPFFVDNSDANGSLAVTFSNGKVSDLRLLSPAEAVAFVSRSQLLDLTLVASLR